MKRKEIYKYQDAVAKATEELIKNSDKSDKIIEAIFSTAIGNIAILSQFIKKDYFQELLNELPEDILNHVSDVSDVLEKLDSKKIN